MVLQASQMGLGATVRTEEPANSIPELPYYAREQECYPRICRQRCFGKSRKRRQCTFFLRGSPRRKVATYFGLFAVESAPDLSALQNGEYEISDRPHEERRLADQGGHKGCVLACPTPPRGLTPAWDPFERWFEMEIQSHALWTEHRPVNIHEADEDGSETLASRWDPSSGVFGRHSNNVRVQGAGHRGYPEDDPAAGEVGVCYKFQKIHSVAVTGAGVSGLSYKHTQYELECPKNQDEQSSSRSTANLVQRQLACEEISRDHRPNEFDLQCNVTGHVNDPILIGKSHRSVKGKRIQLEQHEGKLMESLERRVDMVDRGGPEFQWPNFQPTENRTDHFHGRIGAWMGWSMWIPFMLGFMAGYGVLTIIQSEGTDGDPQSSRKSSAHSQRQAAFNHVGQHHGGGQCCERRGKPQYGIYPPPENPFPNTEESGLFHRDEARSWEEQCVCRCSLPQDIQGRIPSISTCSEPDCPQMGQTFGRHVRDLRERNCSQILLVESGSECSSARCLQPSMDRGDPAICSPTNSIDSQGNPQIQDGSGQQDDTGAAVLAISSILANAHAIEDRSSSLATKLSSGSPEPSTSNAEPPNDSDLNSIMRETPTKVPLIRETYIMTNPWLEGLTETSISLLRKEKIKGSTSKTYQTAWKSFAKCCNKNGYTAEKATSIVNWMAELNETRMKYRSIRSYCVAVCSTIESATRKRMGQHPLIALTLKTLKINGVQSFQNHSMWDVKAVLERMKKVTTNGLKDVSKKTAFLLALCTCWRPAADLTRIPLDTVKFLDDGSVELQAVNVKEGGSKIAKLTPFPEEAICPVSAIRQYIKMTKDSRKNQDGMFFVKSNGENASPDTLRRWIKEMFGELGIDVTKFKPHSLRASSSSTLLKNGTKLSEVMKLGNWTNASTFKNHYWRPVVAQMDTPTNGIQELLQSPNEVLPSNNEGTDVIPECIQFI